MNRALSKKNRSASVKSDMKNDVQIKSPTNYRGNEDMENIKERITGYWSKRADSFCCQRIKEFRSEKKERWMSEFDRYLPKGKKLRILDLGTGTGFFSFLLASQGHEVVGIDMTEEMIQRANDTKKYLGIDADFYVMDAEDPEFEPESFDAIVTRNLTWTLPGLKNAYCKWYKLLKPGGVLINFDADYARCLTTHQDQWLPENHAHKDIPDDMMLENNEITLEVGALHKARPAWDQELLKAAKFSHIITDTGVWKRVYAEIDEFYNPTPIFTVAAVK